MALIGGVSEFLLKWKTVDLKAKKFYCCHHGIPDTSNCWYIKNLSSRLSVWAIKRWKQQKHRHTRTHIQHGFTLWVYFHVHSLSSGLVCSADLCMLSALVLHMLAVWCCCFLHVVECVYLCLHAALITPLSSPCRGPLCDHRRGRPDG